uniref:Ig-like domain-containing protein n=1 Tax=Neolamprologus brichardi TaxID=32507 RepID=A0A3Q4I547_NEOBR
RNIVINSLLPLLFSVESQDDYAVTYTSTQICAVKGSTEVIGCSFKYPSRYPYLRDTVWFTKGNGNKRDDLKRDPVYAGRVSYSCGLNSCTLTIRDLRESHSAVYKFRFEANQKSFTGLPGVTLNVTVLQVHVDTSSYPDWATLTCQSSCRLNNHLFYAWYKNGQKISTQSDQYWYTDNLNSSDSYSCAVTGHEDFPSPSVYIPEVPSVTVSPSGEIVEGSSVTLACTGDANPMAKYTWYKEQKQISHEKQINFRSIQSSDSGEYYSRAPNLNFSLLHAFGINLSTFLPDAPKLPFVSVSPSAEIVEGSSVSLTCSSDANPAADYTWYKDKKLMSREQQLTFSSIQSSDSGEYCCTAENELGKNSSEVISINVKCEGRQTFLILTLKCYDCIIDSIKCG